LFGHAVTSSLPFLITRLSLEVPGTCFAKPRLGGCNGAAEGTMKIYLLVMLMGALFTAIRFTTTQEQQSNSLPQ
jgi:hypothetical protein